MERDARALPDGSILEADLCVVGGGPVGLALAREFVVPEARGVRVLVLESGGREADAGVRALAGGEVSGDPMTPLEATRCWRLGGTPHLWNTPVGPDLGAKYARLAAVDFEPRPWLPWSGWPFPLEILAPHYRRAEAVCGLGEASYEAGAWAEDGCRPLATEGSALSSGVYRLGPRDPFVRVWPDVLRAAPNIEVWLHASAVWLEAGRADEEVREVRVRCLTGSEHRVRARLVVLAAGGLENARLLLLSRGARREGLGNARGLVGRGLMEHPRDVSLVLVPGGPDPLGALAFYDARPTGRGWVMGRLEASEEARRREDRLACSVTLLARGRRSIAPGLGPRLAGWLRGKEASTGLRGGAMGWSRPPARRGRVDRFQLLLNVEQAPDPGNRVALGFRPDALGQPVTEVHWRWSPRDQRHLERARALVAEGLAAAGAGRVWQVASGAPDPNAHHQMGATRMHRDPREGVVDETCRVHGVQNLFVVGTSVFATAGFANPTLTALALALRLADHLKGRLGVPAARSRRRQATLREPRPRGDEGRSFPSW